MQAVLGIAVFIGIVWRLSEDRKNIPWKVVGAGVGSLIPEKRAEIAGLTLRSLIVGNLATLMTAAVIGLVG